MKKVTKYNGKVPSNRKELELMPGVGRKTTNVVLSELFDIPTMAVDTHVERVSKRLKIAKQTATVKEVENSLMKKIPKERWIKTHHQFTGAICMQTTTESMQPEKETIKSLHTMTVTLKDYTNKMYD